MRYRRIPRRVVARVLEAPWDWETARGERMCAGAGDYRITDPATGDEWSVEPGAFADGYTLVGDDEYETRGTVTGRQVVAHAEPVRVDSLEGPETAWPGDWILRDDEGNEWVVADAYFRLRYTALAG